MEYLVIIFFFILLFILIDNHYSIKKRKIDAALRMREMEAGVPPGTYSRYSKSDAKKRAKRKNKEQDDEEFFSTDERSEKQEREELLKGIQDLKNRIANIDIIMKEKKSKGEDVK